MKYFNGFTSNNDPVYYSSSAKQADGTLTSEGTKKVGTFREIGNSPTITAITPAATDKELTDDVLDEIISNAKTAMEQYLALALKAERAATLQPEPTKAVAPSNSFTDSDLAGMAHGDNPVANAYRELLAYRCNSPVIPGWIPVSERMPGDRESVLLWDADLDDACSGHYSHETGNFYQAGMIIDNDITHWQPMPAAPKAAQNSNVIGHYQGADGNEHPIVNLSETKGV